MNEVTEEEMFIKSHGKNGRVGGWTRATLAEWGVPWPPPRGWKKVLLKYGSPFDASKLEEVNQVASRPGDTLMDKTYQEVEALALALEAFEEEKNDPLNAGLTFTDKGKQAYLARTAYLRGVFYDNNHRNVLALCAEIKRLRKLVEDIRTYDRMG